MTAGATLYLTKPFHPRALAEQARALVESNAAAGAEEHARVALIDRRTPIPRRVHGRLLRRVRRAPDDDPSRAAGRANRRARRSRRPTLEELFRSFHSLKGLSGMVELRDAELLAHQHGELSERARGTRSRPTAGRRRGADRRHASARAGHRGAPRRSTGAVDRAGRRPARSRVGRRIRRVGSAPASRGVERDLAQRSGVPRCGASCSRRRRELVGARHRRRSRPCAASRSGRHPRSRAARRRATAGSRSSS